MLGAIQALLQGCILASQLGNDALRLGESLPKKPDEDQTKRNSGEWATSNGKCGGPARWGPAGAAEANHRVKQQHQLLLAARFNIGQFDVLAKLTADKASRSFLTILSSLCAFLSTSATLDPPLPLWRKGGGAESEMSLVVSGIII